MAASSNGQLSPIVDTLSKGIAAIAIGLYASGFLIVSISHSRYGFVETNPFRPKILAAGAVSHNIIFFNRHAIEACVGAREWDNVEHYAAALERGMDDEPTPMTDFHVARARLIAAAGKGRKDEVRLRALIDQARAAKWQAVIPALEAALAG